MDKKAWFLTPVVYQCIACRAIVTDSLTHEIQVNEEQQTITTVAAVGIIVGADIQEESKDDNEILQFSRVNCAACGTWLGKYYLSTWSEGQLQRKGFVFELSNLCFYQLACSPIPSRICPSPVIEELEKRVLILEQTLDKNMSKQQQDYATIQCLINDLYAKWLSLSSGSR